MAESISNRWNQINQEIWERQEEINRLQAELKMLGDELIDCCECGLVWGLIKYPRPKAAIEEAGWKYITCGDSCCVRYVCPDHLGDLPEHVRCNATID